MNYKDPEYRRIYKRHYRWKLKLEALNAYGGHCSICGISNPQYLTVDHIDNDGADHREQVMGSRRAAGWNFYAWLRKEKYPPGYQILCWNHNSSKDTHPELCEEAYIICGDKSEYLEKWTFV